MIDIQRKYPRHTEEMHLIQSWECSRGCHCPLTLTVAELLTGFYCKHLWVSACGLLWLSVCQHVQPMLRAGWKCHQENVHCLPMLHLSTNERQELVHTYDSFLISIQFLRGSQYDWALTVHSGKLLINSPCIGFLTFHISFSHLHSCCLLDSLPE